MSNFLQPKSNIKMMTKYNGETIIGVEYKGVAGHYLVDVWGKSHKWSDFKPKKK